MMAACLDSGSCAEVPAVSGTPCSNGTCDGDGVCVPGGVGGMGNTGGTGPTGGAGGSGTGGGGGATAGKVGIAAGGDHACAIQPDGHVYCWGSNSDGQLGDGTFGDSSLPVLVEGVRGAVAVDTGTAFSCALVAPSDRLELGGKIYCWGSSSFGQRGDGTFADSNVAVEVTGITDAVDFDLGNVHACAVHADGALSCWGSGSSGKLGNGITGDHANPQIVSTITDAHAVGLSNSATCVVHDDTTVSCVGLGPLGDNTGSPSTSFVDVLHDNSVTTFDKADTVDGGMGHMCALEQTGLIRCWGVNNSGQLGDGSQLDRFGAREILGFNATDVAAGAGHSCATTPANEVFCWGTDPNATGVGSTLSPVQVLGVPAAVGVAAGNGFTCMVAADGSGFCWGEGSSGQLGNGMTADSSGPVQIVFP